MKVLFICCVFLGILTVRLLKPGHVEEDYPITMFFENKGFSIFLQTDHDIYKFEGCFLNGKVL